MPIPWQLKRGLTMKVLARLALNYSLNALASLGINQVVGKKSYSSGIAFCIWLRFCAKLLFLAMLWTAGKWFVRWNHFILLIKVGNIWLSIHQISHSSSPSSSWESRKLFSWATVSSNSYYVYATFITNFAGPFIFLVLAFKLCPVSSRLALFCICLLRLSSMSSFSLSCISCLASLDSFLDDFSYFVVDSLSICLIICLLTHWFVNLTFTYVLLMQN